MNRCEPRLLLLSASPCLAVPALLSLLIRHARWHYGGDAERAIEARVKLKGRGDSTNDPAKRLPPDYLDAKTRVFVAKVLQHS